MKRIQQLYTFLLITSFGCYTTAIDIYTSHQHEPNAQHESNEINDQNQSSEYASKREEIESQRQKALKENLFDTPQNIHDRYDQQLHELYTKYHSDQGIQIAEQPSTNIVNQVETETIPTNIASTSQAIRNSSQEFNQTLQTFQENEKTTLSDNISDSTSNNYNLNNSEQRTDQESELNNDSFVDAGEEIREINASKNKTEIEQHLKFLENHVTSKDMKEKIQQEENIIQKGKDSWKDSAVKWIRKIFFIESKPEKTIIELASANTDPNNSETEAKLNRLKGLLDGSIKDKGGLFTSDIFNHQQRSADIAQLADTLLSKMTEGIQGKQLKLFVENQQIMSNPEASLSNKQAAEKENNTILKSRPDIQSKVKFINRVKDTLRVGLQPGEFLRLNSNGKYKVITREMRDNSQLTASYRSLGLIKDIPLTQEKVIKNYTDLRSNAEKINDTTRRKTILDKLQTAYDSVMNDVKQKIDDQSFIFDSNKIKELLGIDINNPSMTGTKVVDAYKKTIHNLGKHAPKDLLDARNKAFEKLTPAQIFDINPNTLKSINLLEINQHIKSIKNIIPADIVNTNFDKIIESSDPYTLLGFNASEVPHITTEELNAKINELRKNNIPEEDIQLLQNKVVSKIQERETNKKTAKAKAFDDIRAALRELGLPDSPNITLEEAASEFDDIKAKVSPPISTESNNYNDQEKKELLIRYTKAFDQIKKYIEKFEKNKWGKVEILADKIYKNKTNNTFDPVIKNNNTSEQIPIQGVPLASHSLNQTIPPQGYIVQ